MALRSTHEPWAAFPSGPRASEGIRYTVTTYTCDQVGPVSVVLATRYARPRATPLKSAKQAQARKLAAEADLAEIELAERRGQLVSAAFFRQEYEGACAWLRAVLLNADG